MDIEDQKGNLKDHKNILDLISIKDFSTTTQFEAKQTYYQWAREKLNEGNFKSDRDKLIWEFHADGLPTRSIANATGLAQPWVVRQINKAKEYLEAQSVGSGSNQLDLFFWAEPWSYFKWKQWSKRKRPKSA